MNFKAMAMILIGLIAASFLSGCAQPPAGCTAEAKVCPDGTTVGRNPALNCEFDPCPVTGGEAGPENIPMPVDTGEGGAPPELPL